MAQSEKKFTVKKFKQGDYIMKEGEQGDFVVLITSGSADIIRNISNGKEKIGAVGVGEIVGEMAVLNEEPRWASVVAKGDVEVVVIQNRTLQKALVNDDLPIVYELIKQLVLRLQETEKYLEEYLQVNVPARYAERGEQLSK